MEQSRTRTVVVLIGAGRVGTAVALLLQSAGHRIACVGPPDRPSSVRAARLLRTELCRLDSLPHADVVLLGAPQDAIRQLAIDLSASLRRGALVVHFSGAVGLDPLDAVRSAGAIPCALHPVQACPDVETALRRLPGSAWGVTCPALARDRAESLVEEVGGVPVAVADSDRALWHAAAAVVANGTTALLAAGEAMLTAMDVSTPSAVLGPLASGAVANARERGAAATLTGPVVRGDVDVVRRHLAALQERAPQLVTDYRKAALLTLSTARAAGRVDRDSYAELHDTLMGP